MKYIYKFYRTYNHTHQGKKKIYYPKNLNQLINILKLLKKKNIIPLVISGSCGYGDKSFLSCNNFVIDLSKFNKILKISTKKKFVITEAGTNLFYLSNKLIKKKMFIYNIPGGKGISVGGAISGNVHGRPQEKKFSCFGDNILSLKILDKNFKIKKYNKKNIKLKKIIGSLGLEGIILEAKIKTNILKKKYLLKVDEEIFSKKKFKEFDGKHKTYYGFIDYFAKNEENFHGKFTYFVNILKGKNLKNKKNIDLFYLINLLKIDSIAKFIINKFTLKFFYFFLFYLKKNSKKKKKVSFFSSIYFANITNFLPFYFRQGMLEIQFSINDTNLFDVIKSIKKIQNSHNIYPHFFILKKMFKSKQKYFFNFPLFNHCITLSYAKNYLLKDKLFFKKLYKILWNYNCNLYLTKDEITADLNPNYKNLIKSAIKVKIKNKINDFYSNI